MTERRLTSPDNSGIVREGLWPADVEDPEEVGRHRETTTEGQSRRIANAARLAAAEGNPHDKPYRDSAARREQEGGPDRSDRPRRPQRRGQEVSQAQLDSDSYRYPPASKLLGSKAVGQPSRLPARTPRKRRGRPTPTPPSLAEVMAREAAAIARDRDRDDPHAPTAEEQATQRLPHQKATSSGMEAIRAAMMRPATPTAEQLALGQHLRSLPPEDREGHRVDHHDPDANQP